MKIKLKIENEQRDLFKMVRNQLRNYTIKSTVLLCIEELHKINLNNITTRKGFMPWYLLFIIRLSFIYGENKYPPKELNKNKLIKIYNLVYKLGDRNTFTENKDYISAVKFFRSTSFQQFWFQQKLSYWDINHQVQLFYILDWGKYQLNDIFLKHTGLSIYEFLELFYASSAYFPDNNHKVFITSNYYSTIKNYSQLKIDKFLNLISLDLNEAKAYARKNFTENNIGLHIMEESPFSRYPLIKFEDKYFCYSPELLNLGIKNFIYDYLKNKEKNSFCEKFGNVFEKYIEIGLNSICANYLNENQIKKLFNKSKVIDYIVNFDKCCLLIEAKAVEMNYYARINPVDEVLNENLKNNIIKAVEQIYSLIDSNNKEIKIKNLKEKEIFVFVITYRQHYLGSGKEFWDELLYNSLNIFFQNNYINSNILNPERIFYIDITEFDHFIHCIYNNKNPYDILKKAFEFNSNSSKLNKKHTFLQHLEIDDLNIDNCPQYASEQFKIIHNNLLKKIQNHF